MLESEGAEVTLISGTWSPCDLLELDDQDRNTGQHTNWSGFAT